MGLKDCGVYSVLSLSAFAALTFARASEPKLSPQVALYGVSPQDKKWCAFDLKYISKNKTVLRTTALDDPRPGSNKCGNRGFKQEYFEIDFEEYFRMARQNPKKPFNANFLSAVEALEKHYKVSTLSKVTDKARIYLRTPTETNDVSVYLIVAETESRLIHVGSLYAGGYLELIANESL